MLRNHVDDFWWTCVLNTVLAVLTGTHDERGIAKWIQSEDAASEKEQLGVYDLPLVQPWLNKLPFTKYVPFCPGFRGDKRRQRASETSAHAASDGQVNEAFEPHTTHL